MNSKIILSSEAAAFMAVMVLSAPVLAATSPQPGPSGQTYASGMQCALHPIDGFAPFVTAGLLNPKRNTTGTVSLNDEPVATVTFMSPDTNVWLANQINSVVVAVDRGPADSYSFDASDPDLPNICIPDTSSNTVSGDLEYAASGKSYATVTPGCALNPLTGRAQPYVNLIDNGNYLLNVSVNNVPLTQLSSRRRHTPVFLSAGLNVISAANGSLSIDYYVRDVGDGKCNLP